MPILPWPLYIAHVKLILFSSDITHLLLTDAVLIHAVLHCTKLMTTSEAPPASNRLSLNRWNQAVELRISSGSCFKVEPFLRHAPVKAPRRVLTRLATLAACWGQHRALALAIAMGIRLNPAIIDDMAIDPSIRLADGHWTPSARFLAGWTRCLRILLAAGHDINRRHHGLTPLHQAVRFGHSAELGLGLGLALILLDLGANPLIGSSDRRSTLEIAMLAGQLPITRRLLAMACELPPGCTLLAYAASSGSPDMVNWALTLGGDPAESSVDPWSPSRTNPCSPLFKLSVKTPLVLAKLARQSPPLHLTQEECDRSVELLQSALEAKALARVTKLSNKSIKQKPHRSLSL